MYSGDLKYYNKYIKALLAYAIGSKIKVKISKTKASSWYPTDRQIIIESDLEQSECIATLLHELGHSLDEMLDKGGSKTLWKSYKALYEEKATRKQGKNVVDIYGLYKGSSL